MNLIEQLGGYECAAYEYKNTLLADDFPYVIKATGTKFTRPELGDELLEHRRQHNIFEAGDDVVVLTNALGNKYTWIVKSIDGIMVEISQLGQPNEWVHYSEIAHTTPEEIKAGKRLEVK